MTTPATSASVSLPAPADAIDWATHVCVQDCECALMTPQEHRDLFYPRGSYRTEQGGWLAGPKGQSTPPWRKHNHWRAT